MTNTPFGFSLANIQTLQFALFPENRSEPYSDEFTINTELEYGLSTVERGLRIQLGFLMTQDDKPQIKIEVATDFLMDENTWNKCHNGHSIVLPKDFLWNLVKISIGTARGILHARTRETVYGDFLFPLLDISQLIQEDVSFTLN